MLKRIARAIWPSLPGHRANFQRWIWRRWREGRTIGWVAALRLGTARPGHLARIRIRGHRHPLFFRPGGSDWRVIEQVLIEREYECLAVIPNLEFIVDCGANIGCTTFHLLHRHPAARAIVIEPDEGNMAVCRRNLAAFGDRVIFIQAGVWSVAGDLVVERGTHRDGNEWSFQVRLARPGETAEVPAISIPEVVARAGFPHIDALKMDIEGSEAEVFRTGWEAWLPFVKNIAVELHGPECERVVNEAMASFRFERTQTRELTVFRNIQQA
jgi:FkbM family methyltransferase